MPIVLADQLDSGDLDGLDPGRLATVVSGDATFLVSLVDPSLDVPFGLTVSRLASNGALRDAMVYATRDDPLSGIAFGGGGLVSHQIGGVGYVYVAGRIDGLPLNGVGSISVLAIGEDGTPSVVQSFDFDEAAAGIVPQNDGDPKVVTVEGAPFLVVPNVYGDELTAFAIAGDGKLTERGSIEFDNGQASLAMDAVSVGDRTFVVAADFYATAPLSVFELDGSGDFDKVFSSDRDEPLLYNRIINDVTTAMIGGKTFVFSSENTRGSIAVHQLNPDGSLQIVAFDVPHYGTDSWGMPYALDSFEYRGETYLAAGGNGSSIAVFAVSAAGALVEAAEFDFGGFSPRYVNDLDATVLDGKVLIEVSNEKDQTIQSFRFTPGSLEIDGGKGRDLIDGRTRDDLIRAGGGKDVVAGKAGDDLVEGGGGADRISGGLGDDDLYGGAGSDHLVGGDGNDWLFGGAGGDTLSGGIGEDFLRGEAGNDRIAGGDGDDRLFGDAGNDRLSGGDGADVLADGTGQDALTGGDFGDTFVMADDGARDRITDFEDGQDLIDLTAEGEDLAFADISVRRSGDGLLLRYGDDSIQLEAHHGTLRVTDIGLDDFLLA